MVLQNDRLRTTTQLITSGLQQSVASTGQFIRENPAITGATIGATALGGLVAIQAVRVSKRRKKKVSRKKTRKKTGKRTRRKTTKTGKRRGIIRGRGLGRSEIKHSGKSTKGTKLVSFRTKSGKLVRFKRKGTSKRRKGFRKR